MKDFEVMLEKYADLVVKVGVNVQPGQVLMIHSPPGDSRAYAPDRRQSL